MRKLWYDQAWADYLEWNATDKKSFKKINALIKAIDREPYEGEGKPEPLKYELSGWWSRRIEEKFEGLSIGSKMAFWKSHPAKDIIEQAIYIKRGAIAPLFYLFVYSGAPQIEHL